ncbi:MAG: carotenoid biosynthesis protein, partial [Halobacteriales archaeon]
MPDGREFARLTVGVGVVALVHAALTWPPAAVVALFGGGAAIAFAGEAIVISLGWLEHHVGPTVLGVPLYVLAGWTGIAYAAFRVALLATDGVMAVALAATLATGYDVLSDHRGVAEGYWTY